MKYDGVLDVCETCERIRRRVDQGVDQRVIINYFLLKPAEQHPVTSVPAVGVVGTGLS